MLRTRSRSSGRPRGAAVRFGGALLLLLTVALAGCESRTGPEFDSQLQVILRTDGAAATVLGAGAVVDVPPGIVGRLELQFSRVEALPAGASAGDPQAWRALAVARGEVDLLALPDGGTELVAGTFPSGSYSQLRLFTPGGSVTLTDPLPTNPDALPPGSYPASVPAGMDFGIDVAGAGFEVPAEAQATVVVVADLGETLSDIEWTGEFFLVRPVFRSSD